MRIILSTGNIIGSGTTSLGHTSSQRSNLELVSSLHLNIDEGRQSSLTQSNGDVVNGNHASRGYDWKRWTSLQDNGQTLYVPAIDFTASGLQEEREQYDITVKLFYLRSNTAAQREEQTRQAVQLVLKELHVPSIGLLIVSFPGIYFDETEGSPKEINGQETADIRPESLDLQLETWKVLEALCYDGLVEKIGVAEFGADRLESLLSQARIPPVVDQINLRDSCSVPKTLLGFAKGNGIELLVHNDCTDILPRGTVRELLGQGNGGAGILAGEQNGGEKKKLPLRASPTPGIQGEVLPQWVVKYTAVVANRGVVENKGYFALAEVTG